MAEIQIERHSAINTELLDEELQAVTGYLGCSASPGKVRVFFEGNADISGMQAIVAAHDGNARSNREAQLDALRSDIAGLKTEVGDIDSLSSTEATAAIKLLYKVLRLNNLI